MNKTEPRTAETFSEGTSEDCKKENQQEGSKKYLFSEDTAQGLQKVQKVQKTLQKVHLEHVQKKLSRGFQKKILEYFQKEVWNAPGMSY